MNLDWSAQGRARVFALMVLGTVICICLAFAIDSFDVATGGWRWGSDPINNFVIPALLCPPFFFLLLDKTRQLAIAHNELMTVAATDSLTSLLNRRAFTELVDGYLKRVEESDKQADGALHARLNVTKARRRQCTLQAPALNDTYQNHNDRNDQQAVYQPAHRVRGDQTEQPQNNQNDRNAFKHFAAPCAVR